MVDVGAYSFFSAKNLGAYGDGGLIGTNDDGVAEMARMLRAHGAKKKYHNEVLGYNSRLDTIQAAILRVKLPYIDEWNEGRRRVATVYKELLANCQGIVTPDVVDGHVFHQYTVGVISGRRDELANELRKQGIGTMIYYPIPQDRLPVYDGQYGTLPASESMAQKVLSFPIWPELKKNSQEHICQKISDLIISN
jgi:dTDP-4-amino-4,6-dideoxygalactose transaminase